MGNHLESLKYDVIFGTTSFKSTGSDFKGIKVINISFLRVFDQFERSSFVKSLMKKCFSFFNYLTSSLNKRLKEFRSVDIMLVGGSYDMSLIEGLKKEGKRLYFNHPGDIELMNKWLFGDGVEGFEKYSIYLNLFDKVIFQSKNQMLECREATELDNLFYLNPICNEEVISDVKTKDNLNVKEHFDKDHFHIVVIGTVMERKNQHIIAQEIARLESPVKIHLVGNIPDEEFQKLVLKNTSTNNQTKVVFHGFRKDYLFFMKYADLLMNFSTNEGVSRVIREAMFMGKLILASNLSGTIEYLIDNSGIIIDVERPDQIHFELGHIISNPNLKKAYEEKASQVYLQNFGSKRYKEELESLY